MSETCSLLSLAYLLRVAELFLRNQVPQTIEFYPTNYLVAGSLPFSQEPATSYDLTPENPVHAASCFLKHAIIFSSHLLLVLPGGLFPSGWKREKSNYIYMKLR